MITTLGRRACPEEAPRRMVPLLGVVLALAVAAAQFIASHAMGGFSPMLG